MEDTEIEYEVKEIIGMKVMKKKLFYRVVWKGFDMDDATWEPIDHLTNTIEKVKEYHRKIGLICEECDYLARTKRGLEGHRRKKH